MNTKFLIPAIALAIAAVHAVPLSAQVVDVDATTLGVPDGTPVLTLSNPGSAGNFVTNLGAPLTASQPANNNPGVLIQGVDFSGAKMISANSAVSTGLGGNGPHTVKAWVWNPSIAGEEAIAAWGRRGGPDGTNMGFHQGTDGSHGAVGHWGGGPDVPYGTQNGTNINNTTGRWAQLAYTFNGSQSRVFIDGLLSNSENGTLNTHTVFNDNVTPIPIALGSEHNADNPASNPVDFTGIIADVEVYNTALSDQEIANSFAAESPFFFDGIQPQTNAVPEPGSLAIFSIAGLVGLGVFAWRRRRGRA